MEDIDSPKKGKSVRTSRAAFLSTLIASKTNKRAIWSSEFYVNTSFALRQFAKVFHISLATVKKLDELLSERSEVVFVQPSSSGAIADTNTNGVVDEQKEVNGEERSSSPNENSEEAKDKESVDGGEGTTSANGEGEGGSSISNGPSHDLPPELAEMFLKLMIPCSRRQLLGRMFNCVSRTLPTGIPNPLGEDKQTATTVGLPTEARLYLLSAVVETRMMTDNSQNVDEEHPPTELRPVDLGKDGSGNQYWYFHDMKIWAELKNPRKYVSDQPVDLSDASTWEWAYDIVSSRTNWLCIADYEEDETSWMEFGKALKSEPKVFRAFEQLWKEVKEEFEQEMARRKAERENREKEERAREMKRLRELERQFVTEDVGGYGLRLSSRIRDKQKDLEEKRKREKEEEDQLDEMIGLKRPRRGTKYEEDSDFALDSDDEKRTTRGKRTEMDPSHGMSRQERMALRQARLAETQFYGGGGTPVVPVTSSSDSPSRMEAGGSPRTERDIVRDVRNSSMDSSGSSGQEGKRQVQGVGGQGEFVYIRRAPVPTVVSSTDSSFNGNSSISDHSPEETENGHLKMDSIDDVIQNSSLDNYTVDEQKSVPPSPVSTIPTTTDIDRQNGDKQDMEGNSEETNGCESETVGEATVTTASEVVHNGTVSGMDVDKDREDFRTT